MDKQQDEKRFRICHASRAGNRKCPVTGKWIDGPVEGWVVACGHSPVSVEGMGEVPSDLLALCDALKGVKPVHGEHEYCIAHSDSPGQQRPFCAVDWMTDEPLHRGDGVRWGISPANGSPRLLAPPAAWRLAPSLASVLHAAGQLPARPATKPIAPPPPPRPPTAEEKRASAIRKAAIILGNDPVPSPATMTKAERLLGAIYDYLETR